MLSDRHTKEPGSMAWQPESIFNRRDDHIVTLPSPLGSAPMRFTHTYRAPHTSASPNHGVLHTGSTFLGVPHTAFMGGASDDLTAGHPTSDTICSEGRAWSPHPDSNP